jgi:ABC-type phosphate transport system permease subunit
MDGKSLVAKIVDLIIDPVVILVFSAGVFLFTWGLVVFLTKLDSSEARKEGVQHMLWGIVGLFIMATVFGIISILANTFGLDIPAS